MYPRLGAFFQDGGDEGARGLGDGRIAILCGVVLTILYFVFEGYLPPGQAFQTNSLTLPTVVSGSNPIVRRFPEMSRNVRDICGVCGISSRSSTLPSFDSPSPCDCSGSTSTTRRASSRPAASTRVYEVRADALAVYGLLGGAVFDSARRRCGSENGCNCVAERVWGSSAM